MVGERRIAPPSTTGVESGAIGMYGAAMIKLLDALTNAFTNRRCPVCAMDMRAAGIKPVGKLGACSEDHAHELDLQTAY